MQCVLSHLRYLTVASLILPICSTVARLILPKCSTVVSQIRDRDRRRGYGHTDANNDFSTVYKTLQEAGDALLPSEDPSAALPDPEATLFGRLRRVSIP